MHNFRIFILNNYLDIIDRYVFVKTLKIVFDLNIGKTRVAYVQSQTDEYRKYHII